MGKIIVRFDDAASGEATAFFLFHEIQPGTVSVDGPVPIRHLPTAPSNSGQPGTDHGGARPLQTDGPEGMDRFIETSNNLQALQQGMLAEHNPPRPAWVCSPAGQSRLWRLLPSQAEMT